MFIKGELLNLELPRKIFLDAKFETAATQFVKSLSWQICVILSNPGSMRSIKIVWNPAPCPVSLARVKMSRSQQPTPRPRSWRGPWTKNPWWLPPCAGARPWLRSQPWTRGTRAQPGERCQEWPCETSGPGQAYAHTIPGAHRPDLARSGARNKALDYRSCFSLAETLT